MLENFKPNLIPNNPKDGSFDLDKAVMKNGGYREYFITAKKDGCRLQIQDGNLYSRAMKLISSDCVLERFQPLADICKELNIALDGEFYAHGMSFGDIVRFFKKKDVTDSKYKKQLTKSLEKDPAAFLKDYGTTDLDYLTTFHEDLHFWLFDGIVLDRPDLVGFEERIDEICNRLELIDFPYLEIPTRLNASNKKELKELFDKMTLDYGFEGLVLTHNKHEYNFGRNTLNQGTLLKMKNDKVEYDGIVIDVLEGTKVKEGIETTTDELGHSRTSKKKGDREPSGLAKGFLVQYEDKGTFTVGLNGFSENQKRHLLEDKSDFIGRHFRYIAMTPTKDFPRHAYFSSWRDEK